VFDVKNDGFIDCYELFQVLKLMVGSNLDDDDLLDMVNQTIDKADVLDKDGKISFVEFCDIYAEQEILDSISISV
jgi:serine/threonine-protein phosphatase 2B regulatory subunit